MNFQVILLKENERKENLNADWDFFSSVERKNIKESRRDVEIFRVGRKENDGRKKRVQTYFVGFFRLPLGIMIFDNPDAIFDYKCSSGEFDNPVKNPIDLHEINHYNH